MSHCSSPLSFSSSNSDAPGVSPLPPGFYTDFEDAGEVEVREWQGRSFQCLTDSADAGVSALASCEFERFKGWSTLPLPDVDVAPCVRKVALPKVQQPSGDPDAFMNFIQGEGIYEKFLVSRHFFEIREYWSMIVEHGVRIGISLIPLEDDHRCCYPMMAGSWKVSLPELIDSTSLKRRRFELSNSITGETRSLEHFQLDWPNYGIPLVKGFVELMMGYEQLIVSLARSGFHPLVHLHCQGGHGRSGTFLLARALTYQPEGSSVADLLARLRKQRSRLVETQSQFEFAIDQAQQWSSKSFIPGKYTDDYPSQCKQASLAADSDYNLRDDDGLAWACRSSLKVHSELRKKLCTSPVPVAGSLGEFIRSSSLSRHKELIADFQDHCLKWGRAREDFLQEELLKDEWLVEEFVELEVVPVVEDKSCGRESSTEL